MRELHPTSPAGSARRTSSTARPRRAGSDGTAARELFGRPLPHARIVIAAEHTLFREGLRTILEEDCRFVVVDEASNAAEAVQRTRDLQPDVLVLDLRTPGARWARVLKALAAARLSTAIIALSAAADYRDIVKMVDLGASALVLKDSGAEALRRAVWAVLGGVCWIDHRNAAGSEPIAAYAWRGSGDPRTSTRDFGLTPREAEIVSAVAAACANKNIAERFAISEATVKRHLTSIFDKVGVSSRLELAMFALHHGLDHAGITSARKRHLTTDARTVAERHESATRA
jgi:DNA-binding NarL/FixJ family response regulator